MQQMKHVKDLVEIHNIKQKDGASRRFMESFKVEEFMERFKVETGRMKGALECMKIYGFMHGVNNPELTKRLNEHVPKTLEEMMTKTTAFIQGETAAASKNKILSDLKKSQVQKGSKRKQEETKPGESLSSRDVEAKSDSDPFPSYKLKPVMSSYAHPSILSDYDVKDAFSSTNAPNYTPTSPDYSRDFFPPKDISPPKDTETPVESPIPVSPSSSLVRSTTPPPDCPFDESIFAELDNSLWIIP
ncbi:hypothetical protein Tco_0947089 [Tanacetum coccineum]